MAGNFFDQFDTAPAADAGVPMPPPRPPELGGRGAVTAQAESNFFDQFDEPAKAEPSMVEALYRGARQGASFNFGDELEGVGEASGLPDWTRYAAPGARYLAGGARLAAEAVAPSVFGTGATEAYGAAVEKERAANRAAEEAHPVASFAGNLGGAVATAPISPMLAPLRAAQGAGIVARAGAATGNLAATGAAYGGAAGLGAGEGDVVDRLPEAGKGALIGAVATPAIAGAARGVVAGGRFVGDHVRASRDPAAQADRVVQRAFERDGANPRAIADDIDRANPMGPARVRQADGTVVDIPDSHYRVGDQVHAVAPDGSPGELLGQYVAPTRGGQGLIPADIAGPNTQAVAGDIARQPGPGRTAARDFLEARQLGNDDVASQGERITAQLGNILGDGGSIATADGIIATRSAQANKMYDVAFKRRLNYDGPEGQKLLALLDRVPDDAKAAANKILKVSDREGHQLVWNDVPDEAGRFALQAAPNGRQWQYIKEGLDKSIDAHRDAVTGRLDTLGAAVQGLKTEILASLDKLNPAYGAARKTFAGHSELLQALRDGGEAFRPGMTPEAIRKALAGLSPGEADMYRLGAANVLRGRLENMGDGADKARAAYGNPAIREKLNAMMAGNETARADFARYMRNEQAMNSTRNKALGGSPTAERLGDIEDTNEILVGAGKAVVQAGTGHIAGALKTAFGMMQKVDPSKRGRVMSEARKVLYEPDPASLRSFIARVEATPMKRGDKDRLLSTVATALPRSVVSQVTAQ